MTRETVLLMLGDRHFAADVDEGAVLHRVPRRDDVPGELRGLTFERTGLLDGTFHLPIFRRRSRQ